MLYFWLDVLGRPWPHFSGSQAGNVRQTLSHESVIIIIERGVWLDARVIIIMGEGARFIICFCTRTRHFGTSFRFLSTEDMDEGDVRVWRERPEIWLRSFVRWLWISTSSYRSDKNKVIALLKPSGEQTSQCEQQAQRTFWHRLPLPHLSAQKRPPNLGSGRLCPPFLVLTFMAAHELISNMRRSETTRPYTSIPRTVQIIFAISTRSRYLRCWPRKTILSKSKHIHNKLQGAMPHGLH